MVVDVGALLGGGPVSGALRNRIIVVANPNATPAAVGLLVEAVLEARRLDLGRPTGGAGVKGIVVDGERMLPLLDWRAAAMGADVRSP